MMIMQEEALKQYISTVPKRPGVYLFSNEKEKVLYVGKALSLKDRLSSYLDPDIEKIKRMRELATHITHIETGSEFAALLLEARLIKLHLPHYNVSLKDDKSYLYAFLSIGEEFPKVLLARKPKEYDRGLKKYEYHEGLKGVYYGPFTSSAGLKVALKMLRRIFPYCQQTHIGKRACFYSHIGLCRPCPSDIVKQDEAVYSLQKKQYRQNIFHLKKIFDGRENEIEKEFTKNMKQAVKEQDFETAAKLRDKLKLVQSLYTQSARIGEFLKNTNFYFDESQKNTEALEIFLSQHLLPTSRHFGKPHAHPESGEPLDSGQARMTALRKLSFRRIECFDISSFQGKFAVGGQIVFIDGIPEKKWYRRYRIKLPSGAGDFYMLAEMIGRRLKHPEWEMPDLIVVDGGKPQVSVVSKRLEELGIQIPLIGLAKRLEEIVILKNGQFEVIRLPRSNSALQLLQQIRDETHRFAITYHRKVRGKEYSEIISKLKK